MTICRSKGPSSSNALLPGISGYSAQVTTDGKQIPSELEPTFHEVMGRYRFDQHQVPGGTNVRLIEELGLVDYLA